MLYMVECDYTDPRLHCEMEQTCVRSRANHAEGGGDEVLRFETDLVTTSSSPSSILIRCTMRDRKLGLCGLSIIPRSAAFEEAENPFVICYEPMTEQLITADIKG